MKNNVLFFSVPGTHIEIISNLSVGYMLLSMFRTCACLINYVVSIDFWQYKVEVEYTYAWALQAIGYYRNKPCLFINYFLNIS